MSNSRSELSIWTDNWRKVRKAIWNCRVSSLLSLRKSLNFRSPATLIAVRCMDSPPIRIPFGFQPLLPHGVKPWVPIHRLPPLCSSSCSFNRLSRPRRRSSMCLSVKPPSARSSSMERLKSSAGVFNQLKNSLGSSPLKGTSLKNSVNAWSNRSNSISLFKRTARQSW